MPKRSAKKIPRLCRWFELAEQGTIKTIETPDIAGPSTKIIDIPAEAGVNVTKTVKSDGKSSIGIDVAGKKISNGMPSWSFGNAKNEDKSGIGR